MILQKVNGVNERLSEFPARKKKRRKVPNYLNAAFTNRACREARIGKTIATLAELG
jgi:hypothetical protein